MRSRIPTLFGGGSSSGTALGSRILSSSQSRSRSQSWLLCRSGWGSTKRFVSLLHAPPKLKDPSLLIEKCYVNGEFVDASSSRTFDVHDPATGHRIGSCPDFERVDTEKAISAAAEAFRSFRHSLPRERARMLRRWFDLVRENAEDVATLIRWENGKPLAEAKGEVAYAASFLEWFSEEASRIYGDTVPASVAGNRVITLKQPVGVCGLITPWNFPAAMVTRKIGPALAAGCTVVAKSPAETPLTANALAELSRRAGIPPGVVNVITASQTGTAAVGETLSASTTVRKLSFTGSTAVGRVLMRQCAPTLKKLSLELGGNAALIVFDDCPSLDDAVAGTVASKFRSSGQTCICANRIYVQRGIYDAFAARLAESVSATFHVDSGFKHQTTHGPLIHDRALHKVQSHVSDAVQKGASVLTGGYPLPHLGPTFYQPTVLSTSTSTTTEQMQLCSEETFGPLAALFPFSTEAEVVERANDTDVGLAAYVFSADLARVWRVAEALEVGMVGVNTGLISDAAVPFGGVKASGFGREGGSVGVEEYLVCKSVTVGGVGGIY